ncbi:hypothetical protein CF326_g9172, partial [Tilletia indica]
VPLATIRAHEQVVETTSVTNTPARISRCTKLLSFATGVPLATIRAHEQVVETTSVTNTPARISRCTKDTTQTIFASRPHP